MANIFGVNLTFSGLPKVGVTAHSPMQRGGEAAPAAFKTASYASIPYARAPQLTDTVPTRDKSGQPLLAGYETPLNSWIA